MAPYGSAIKAWPSGQIMATDDYPPRWLSRALCKAGRICSACGEGAVAGDHVAIEYRFAGNRNEPLPSPRS